ncbi:uncharacterized protein LOC107003814 [Solanum pennellii]|uniref:Uncharacterized protein LOC107003814 n=1 Tax=Solanum pennellii TaxID=28526 RepID=A0ABM1FJ16_SOLPN|nr:uncharacterized protein LOC107003814 [Solanum pennellii]
MVKEAELCINIPFIEALEQKLGYAKFMRDMVRKKKSKKEYPVLFTVSCTIGLLYFAKVLCDLGSRINLMSLSIYKKLILGDPKPTTLRLLMADCKVKRPIGMLYDVLVKVESFIFLANFVILNYKVDFEVPIILGRLFLAAGHTLSGELQIVFAISYSVESTFEVQIEDSLGVEALAVVIMNFERDCIKEYVCLVAALE